MDTFLNKMACQRDKWSKNGLWPTAQPARSGISVFYSATFGGFRQFFWDSLLYREGTRKWIQNRPPFGEPRCSETQGIQGGLELFGLSEGSSFGLIFGVILGSISGPPDFGTFQVLIVALYAKYINIMREVSIDNK